VKSLPTNDALNGLFRVVSIFLELVGDIGIELDAHACAGHW